MLFSTSSLKPQPSLSISEAPADESSMKNNRKEGRILTSHLLAVEWHDQAHRPRWSVVNLEDISASGACLQLEEPLPPGESVILHYTEGQLPACVRHCRHCEDTYFVGVEFAFNCAWSCEVFEPASMLDPAIYAMS
jgi:hypothetical protein